MDSWDYLCMHHYCWDALGGYQTNYILWLYSHPRGMTLFPKPPCFNYLCYGSCVLASVCIGIQIQILNMHTSRGSVFHYLQILILSSNTKKGEIERTFYNP